MSTELDRLRKTETWIAWVRLGAVPFAIFQVGISTDYPSGYFAWAWITTGLFTAGSIVLFLMARRAVSYDALTRLGVAALVFDGVAVSAYTLIYSYQLGTPIRQALYVPLIEAGVRYGIVGATAYSVATLPILVVFELVRRNRFPHYGFKAEYVTFQFGIEVLSGLIVGWLVKLLRGETARAEARASEAEILRDELGRRADLLDAVNRCARSLSASLELEQAFAGFIRELKGLVTFDRVAIVLAEGTRARVIATGGMGSDAAFPAGSDWPLDDSITAEVLEGKSVVQRDLQQEAKGDVNALVELGLRSRLGVPLLVGAQAIGMLSLSRREVDSFAPPEVELVTLLGRLVGTTVQNIRAYEAERRTVDELRRLSALRADFVSLVSHELRSPMASVIGASRTLQERWRELSPDQRGSFLSLIAEETTRLATLVGDVLDTSRIESGSFNYSFSDLDLEDLVRETVATSQVGQDEVRLEAETPEPLPLIRGDRERLRQVLTNLIDNAVKYSPAGETVRVTAYAVDGCVRVDVRDSGPGIAQEDHRLIFEKFGRANVTGGGKPGTGLGLFIARSIAEAHGGTLDLVSAPNLGSTFRLELPL
jgi:signal transduction histidine kinase